MSELRWPPAREFLPVHPRPGTHVLHPFLRDVLYDPDPEKVQIQPLFSYQGKLTLQLEGGLQSDCSQDLPGKFLTRPQDGHVSTGSLRFFRLTAPTWSQRELGPLVVKDP